MGKILLAALFCVLSTVKGPTLAELDEHRARLRSVLDAIATVESNCDDGATGDGGRAIGRYQLWSSYWTDATEYAPAIGGAYENCRSAEYAERCVVAYWLRYCPQAVGAIDIDTLARVHNGGPKGHKRKATQGYAAKVVRAMRKISGK